MPQHQGGLFTWLLKSSYNSSYQSQPGLCNQHAFGFFAKTPHVGTDASTVVSHDKSVAAHRVGGSFHRSP